MMEEGLINPITSHFMDSDRDVAAHAGGEEEEEFYDFLPFQKEFLIPLRDRAFSWDVSFEDGLHGENEGAPISVISEQQDSHRLVIKAKASGANKRQLETKETATESSTADQAPKKGKAGTNGKKKDPVGIASPTLQAGKANLKAAVPAPTNGKPPVKGAAKAGTAATAPASNKATTATKKNFNVPSSPSTELLDTQTLRNTLSNAKSNADKTDFSQVFVKGEFPDVIGAGMPFGFGNEFETGAGGRSVAFDDGLNMHFKAEEDFPGLHEDAFGDDFRPPRKLSWSIDFSAIEAAMSGEGGGFGGPAEGPGYTGSYLYEGGSSDPMGNQSFPSLLRASDATGSSSGAYGDMSAAGHGGMGSTSSSSSGAHMGMSTTSSQYHSGHHGANPSDRSGASSSGSVGHSSMLPSSTIKAAERDQLASLMSGASQSHSSHAHGHGHSGSGLSMSGGYGTMHSHAGGMGPNSGALLGGETSLSSSGAVGGLTLGGLTVPNDGEFRVGAYTKLERHLKIEAFREKKRTRIWRKQIKYDCRKRLADTRPRVKGRFVSRKGDKGGPFEGEEGEGGPGDNADGGADGAPQPRAPHSLLQGGMPVQGMSVGGAPLPGAAHPVGNMHHQQSHLHAHPAHQNHLSSGMMKHTPGGYVGPNGGNDGHHGAVGGSSIHGIKTEMKYSGSAHMQNTHLQGQAHGHHVPQGHQPATHALPSIPHSMYTPGAVGTAGQGMHHSNVNSAMNRPAMGQMGSAPTHQPHYTPAAAHNLLSQSQQQKLHPQSTMNPNINIHHHPMAPSLHSQGPPTSTASSVPTGLLLSGPSSALLHSTATTAGAVHTVATLPSVASHTAAAAASVAPPLSAVSTVNNTVNGNTSLSMNSVPAPATIPGAAPAGANMYHKPT